MKQINHEGYTIRIVAENVESEQHIRFQWDVIDSDDEAINGGTSPTEQSAIDSGMAAIEEVTHAIVDTVKSAGKRTVKILNPHDSYVFPRQYYVCIGHYRSIEFVIHADSAGSALDDVIDWAELQADNDGWWLSDEDIQAESDILDEYIQGGNHSRYMSFGNEELIIDRLDS